MHIKVKNNNDEGDVLFEGSLNKNEVGFLLMYAINDLLQAGVQFHLEEDDGDEENPAVRIDLGTVQ